MERLLAAFIIISLLSFYSCASTGSGTGLSLHEAIEQSADMIAAELPPGSRVAILAFDSSSDNLSEIIMEELNAALFGRGIEVADRQNLPYVYGEMNFRMSENLSDENAQAIGNFLGASLVISGELVGHSFRVRIIHAEGRPLSAFITLMFEATPPYWRIKGPDTGKIRRKVQGPSWTGASSLLAGAITRGPSRILTRPSN